MRALQRAHRIGLEPSRGLSGRMCRISKPSGRFHDVTFAPCIFTCNCAISIKRHRQQTVYPSGKARERAS